MTKRLILRITVGALTLLPGARVFADVVSELTLRSDSFLSPAFDATPQSSYQFVSANFETDPHKPSDFRIDLQGAYAVGAPLMSYMNVREFAYTFPVGDTQSFTFGRKLLRWNELDRRWNFGLIEPVFKWNPLSPESQGLTGLFWESRPSDNVRLTMFGSFFYLPDQGPSFSIKNGEFERGNPWFSQPPESIRIMKEVSKIEYVFTQPNTSDIVFQTSYGAKVDLGENTPWRLRGSFLYKPMNQLELGYDGALVIARDRGSVSVLPKVGFHRVTAGDAAYIGERVAAGVSAAADSPINESAAFDSQWTHPVYQDAVLISPWMDIRLAKGWKLTLQALDISGGDITETGPLSSPDRASITTHYPYKQARQIGLEFDQRLFRTRLINKVSYMQSEQNEFRIFRWQGRLELSRLWNLQSELQLVEASDMTAENRNSIAEFANNDRVLVGVGYVF